MVQGPAKLPRITKKEFNKRVFKGNSSRLKLEEKYDLKSIKSKWPLGTDSEQIRAFSHYTEGLQEVSVNEYRGTLFGLHAYRKLRKGDEVLSAEDKAILDDLIRNAPKAEKPGRIKGTDQPVPVLKDGGMRGQVCRSWYRWE